ncbi:hypothetical protein UFOVP1522_35 [uncultured Caudovirales phage]|uniref:Uncharacterized protein n=1 Tax=uncultured Caudovirales phage TaxID=2100421 RepID=A0A6J5PXJ5_9CAUD|nr:hypothetical protein UFOVP989_52 [uncultured Caudovirales phage]CAB4181075.1 hypothetical protein UFOVP1075_14 [uncultured Caudovirales phage]CAB4198715.1 hypothetical protein UFOVP1312_6 [uncultured Caudovirales phage]CAB4210904.1 hypothetical protein UFOVP1426_52 [uncultured Caudovirales phage]CAB5227400.1 hypothetical protein UFOVP1522_35 [uncultured Caudovirales phage]
MLLLYIRQDVGVSLLEKMTDNIRVGYIMIALTDRVHIRTEKTMSDDIAEDGVVYQLSNCEVMRIDVDDNHYYFGALTGKEKQYYMSLTNVLDIGGPFPEGLRQYLRVTSFEEQKDRLESTGSRGTKLHSALDMLMQRQALDMREYPTTYEKDAIVTFIRMMRFLTPGKFSTELIVADPDLRIAGTLDFKGYVDEWKLDCLLDPNKYLDIDFEGDYQVKERWLDKPSKKRAHIIIDWKFTGRNAYSHKVQVAAYKTMNNKTRKGSPVSRAFTWRYSPKHKHGFDFQESLLDYQSFKRIYATTIEYLGEFPEPPKLKRFPKNVRLYENKLITKEK